MSVVRKLWISLMFLSSANAISGSNTLDLTEISPDKWYDSCIQAKSELEGSSYSGLLASGTIRLNEIGQLEIDAFGLSLAPPFSIESIRSEVNSNSGTLVIRGSDSQIMVVDVDDIDVVDKSWRESKYGDLRKNSLSDPMTNNQLLYEGVRLTLDDVICSSGDRNGDIWRLAAIQKKSALNMRSPDINRAYLVSDESWTGYATCFERDRYYVLQVEVESGERNIISTIKAIGSCEKLDDHSAESPSDQK